MTNVLVGEVYKKIIEDVIRDSKTEFEENGISQTTLVDLEKEWKTRLSAKDVAHMTWDPKPTPPQPVQQAPIPAPSLPSATNGVQQSYAAYTQNGVPTGLPSTASRIKPEPQHNEPQYHGMPNGYTQNAPPLKGGEARATLLSQQYAQARGLALPGGGRPMQPQGNPQHMQAQQMYVHQQRQQQAALQAQQAQPRIKVENDSPQMHQGSFQQYPRPPNPAYAQTDGADEGLAEWQAYIAARRAVTAEQTERADHMMRDQVRQGAADLASGLMMTIDELPKGARNKNRRARAAVQSGTAEAGPSSVPQLDGVFDEDEKPVKDEDDADAINSDLDSDEDHTGNLDEDDDEFGDSILCTYDKVQRVKNKWKCILKDGVMSINHKEWVFHKGTGLAFED